jgi:ATP-dependent DNA helicase DinG
VDEYFRGGGRLEAVLDGYEPRAEQAVLAAAVAEALAAGEHLVAEAGTGTGKSLAYLIPALESGQRVVVSTATKALQEQLLTKDVPVAAAALGRDVRVAVLKGRQNYLCRHGLQGFGLLGGQLFPREEDAAAFEGMRGWIETTETGDRAELDVEPSETVWAEIAVGADRCLGRRCAFVGVCFSEAARERASHAELVIANHALYFADLGLRSRDVPGVLPEHDAVVFDEAHRLEESAATWLGGRVSGPVLQRLLRDADRACREADVPAPARTLDRVEAAGLRLLAAVAPATGRRRLREVPQEPAGLLADRLAELAAALKGGPEEVDAVAKRALRLAADLAVCLEADDDGNRVVWAEPDTLAWAPVDIGPALEELLWSTGPTAVLVSATLTAGEDDFGFVRERLGLRDASEVAVGSPYDFRSQALLYLPASMPDPRADGALERVADEVAALCRLSAGRALVLTSSYRALDAVAAGIRGRVPYEILVQGEAPRERLLDRFREEVDSVLVATSTFWQGIDVPGESLSLLVIDKLPFAAPGDPLVEARCERIDALGGDWFLEYALPSAVLQLRQGCGRLIRSHADRGVIAILDPRVRSRPYGRAFLQSLPPCPVASERVTVADFFAAGALLSA